MLNGTASIQGILGELGSLSPAGYAIGLHIKLTAPKFLIQTYSRDWTEYYATHRMLQRDPTLYWAMTNIGSIRWADLADEDTSGVLTAAADHGLAFGLVVAVGAPGSKSLANLARNDRAFTDAEIDKITPLVNQLHTRTADESLLSVKDRTTLESFRTS